MGEPVKVIRMIYIGKDRYIPGIPARDLTDEEVKKFGGVAYLLTTGLYKQVAIHPAPSTAINERCGAQSTEAAPRRAKPLVKDGDK